MGKIGEHEKTVIAEPLSEPLPVERENPEVPEPMRKRELVPVEAIPSKNYTR